MHMSLREFKLWRSYPRSAVLTTENHRSFKSIRHLHCTYRSSVPEYFVYHAGTSVVISFHSTRRDSFRHSLHYPRPSCIEHLGSRRVFRLYVLPRSTCTQFTVDEVKQSNILTCSCGAGPRASPHLSNMVKDVPICLLFSPRNMIFTYLSSSSGT